MEPKWTPNKSKWNPNKPTWAPNKMSPNKPQLNVNKKTGRRSSVTVHHPKPYTFGFSFLAICWLCFEARFGKPGPMIDIFEHNIKDIEAMIAITQSPEFVGKYFKR